MISQAMPSQPAGESIPQAGDLAARFYRRDPLLRLLLDRWRFNGVMAYLTVALAGVSAQIILPLIFKHSLGPGYILPSLVQSLGIMPLGAVLYVIVPGLLAGLFARLHEHLVISPPQPGQEKDAYALFLEEATNAADSRWFLILGLGAALAYALYRFLANVPGDYTLEFAGVQRFWMLLALQLVYAPILFGAVTTTGRLITGMIFTRRLFQRFEVESKALNTEGAGGLGILGGLLIRSLLIATALGAAAAVIIIPGMAAGEQLQGRPEAIALGGIYLVFTPLIFSCWLWAPHQALLRARDRAVKPLADEFQRILSQGLPAQEEGAAAMKNRTELLAEIKKQYELVNESFPVWPIPVRTVKTWWQRLPCQSFRLSLRPPYPG
jgi:hypothetical protein